VIILKRTANKEIRNLIKSIGYAQWEVGELLGFGESPFSRLLRKELPFEQKQLIIAKINEIGERK
jgi:predicted XRE-type DNA-binding protein